MHIRGVRILGFQSHEDTAIEYAPNGLTVIVGRTNTGKTAVLRALRWLLTNEPQGDSFIRTGSQQARVIAEYEDGTEVERCRTRGSLNRYILRRPNEEPVVFEGFGYSVPDEIRAVTGYIPFVVDDRRFDLNMSRQLDAPFLGKEVVSAPLRAKVLGKIAGVEIVDTARRSVQTDKYEAQRTVTRLTAEIEELDTHIKEYDYVRDQEERLDVALRKMNAVQDVAEQLETLTDLQDRLPDAGEIARLSDRRTALGDGLEQAKILFAPLAETAARWRGLGLLWMALSAVERHLDAAFEAKDRLPSVNDLERGASLLEQARETSESLSWIRKTAASFNDLAEQIRVAEGRLSVLEGVTTLGDDLAPLAQKYERMRSLADRYWSIEDQISDVMIAQDDKMGEIDVLKQVLETTYQEAGVCPFCGSVIGKGESCCD